MALHRYWRIHITESTAGSNLLISLYEVEFRATQGGSDQCNGGLASASHAGSNAYKLFDNTTSYWVNGGPSEPTWFQYDFGAGNVVDVAEVSLLPRYDSQSPQAFTLQYSDDGAVWLTLAGWAGVSGWVGGVEKLFVPPAPPATMAFAQNSQFFALSLTAARIQSYLFKAWYHAASLASYALHLDVAKQHTWRLLLSKGSEQLFDRWLECSFGQPFSLLLSGDHCRSWKRFLDRSSFQPLYAEVGQSIGFSCSLSHGLRVDRGQLFSLTGCVAKSRAQGFALQQRNGVTGLLCLYWNLSSPCRTLYPVAPAVTLDGLPLSFLSASLFYEPEQMFWSAQLSMALASDFAAIALEDSFSLQVGGESFQFLVDGKRLDRSGGKPAERVLSAISPTARHDLPRAARITKRWDAPIWARDLVEALLGETVVWSLPEWRIRANRLSALAQSPLHIVQQVVAAAGGVVQTAPSGVLSVRPRFPHAVSVWSEVEPLHVLSDDADILELREVQHARVRVDKVVVREEDVSKKRPFSIQLDQRLQGENRGRTHFSPGESLHLLVMAGQDVATSSVTASSGELMSAIPEMWQQVEEVSFVASHRAKLSTPAMRIVSALWLGTDLGMPVLQEDGVTLITPLTGTAVARITSTVVAERYPFTAPQVLGGMKKFPVLFSATGEPSSNGVLEVTAQRGDATHPLLEVASPLLSDYRVLRARAQAELDQGEALQEVVLTILHRPGLEAGQLVEVQDGAYGRSFRALIVGVRHAMDVKGWVSRLALLKRKRDVEI